MCVIIVKKQTGKLDPSIAAQALAYNPHGFGIQTLDDGKVLKTMNIAEAQDWLQSERPYIFHSRLTTVGTTDIDNAHPVKVNEHNWLFHNGTVQVPHTWDKDLSDTRFVADTLRKTPWQSWKDILSLTDSRFAYTRISKSGKVYVNRIGNWHEKGGVYYSKPNVLDCPHLVAVYGTLRKGFGNHRLLSSARLLGAGQTIEQYAMVAQGIPYVASGHREEGHNLRVEVYAVDDATLKQLDQLENHPEWYQRKEIKISLDNGIVVTSWLYFNDTVPIEDLPLLKDYADYREPTSPSVYSASIFDDYTEEDEGYYNSATGYDFIWDKEEEMWFNITTEQYLSDEEYKEISNAQLTLFT
tara:strand:+ start:11198 stop:12262 length:1065 start_codon:yes stop_codon:yes gene_type:complete